MTLRSGGRLHEVPTPAVSSLAPAAARQASTLVSSGASHKRPTPASPRRCRGRIEHGSRITRACTAARDIRTRAGLVAPPHRRARHPRFSRTHPRASRSHLFSVFTHPRLCRRNKATCCNHCGTCRRSPRTTQRSAMPSSRPARGASWTTRSPGWPPMHPDMNASLLALQGSTRQHGALRTVLQRD